MTYSTIPGHVEDDETKCFISDVSSICGDIRILILPTAVSGTSVTDSSRYSHSPTSLQDISNWVDTSNRSLSYNLNGTDEGMYHPDSSDFTFGNGLVDSPFSIFLLVYPTGTLINQWLLTKGESNIYEYEYYVYIDAVKRFRFELVDQSENEWIGRQTGVDITTGSWYFVCCTYDGSSLVGGLKIYVNGIRSDTTDTSIGVYTAMEDTTAGICMGYLTDIFPTTGQNYFKGNIANLGICAKELTSDEVWSLYNLVCGYFGI